MKKLMIAAPVMALLAFPANAVPENKPVNAAEQLTRDSCAVRGAEDQAYQRDNECTAKFTNKRDKDGRLVFQIYRDKGTLQPGQEIDTPYNTREESMIGDYECTTVETATPGGQYSSYRHCRLAE